jgi:hypothetical protein
MRDTKSDVREAKAREIQRRLQIERAQGRRGAPPAFISVHRTIAQHYHWLKSSPRAHERRNLYKKLANQYGVSAETIRKYAMKDDELRKDGERWAQEKRAELRKTQWKPEFDASASITTMFELAAAYFNRL